MVTLKVFLKYHTTSVLWDYEITKVKPKTIALRAHARRSTDGSSYDIGPQAEC